MLELPEDVVEEILCHVPATSLKRLRSTCKEWNRLFNDKRFSRKHFDKAVRQFLVLILTKEFRVCLRSLNLHGILLSIDVINSHSNLGLADIYEVFHHDGLLLCTIRDGSRIVVWNPCTGQTKWIKPVNSYLKGYTYALGSYQDKESGNNNNSYKILSYGESYSEKPEFAIYEINSNSWRILEVTPDFHLVYAYYRVSLKGKTYWFAVDKNQKQLGTFLVSFDYTTERFERMRLPCHRPIDSCGTVVLSVVREEKLSVLLLNANTLKTEIWVTNKIDETKVVSWSMVLAVDYFEFVISFIVSFFVDEEKLVVCCEERKFKDGEINSNDMVHIIGEDNKVTKVDFGASTMSSCWPLLFNYVPSLVQI